ncbi:M23 family metallopeptidase [Clostridium sp. BJN0001]|uniref:M23 family metallopeptidase n=1 Tax=Clostridium sp. BJN0001 TaxID=2930219 RepID=UPI001FCF9B01|nr:M23 family metallopeptidase [Clostridium sp. BJN0001]
MDTNLKQKLKGILKKEGFYIALFVCLCMLVTAGTLSYKNIIADRNANEAQDSNNEIAFKEDSSEVENIQNAERVDNSKDNKDEEKNKKAVSDEKTSKQVSSNSAQKFILPVSGVVSRTYSYPTPIKVEDNTFRNIKGVNIESKIGTDVKAAADGIVVLAENSGVEQGYIVELKHANGIKTIYGNLDPDLKVKKGDNIKAGQVIAKVGETAKVFSKDRYGEFLNLQVLNANNEQVNPSKYFSLKTK